MKPKKLTYKSILASSFIAASIGAAANLTASFASFASLSETPAHTYANVSSQFKIAIVENAPGSDDILEGKYDESLTRINNVSASSIDAFEKSMGVCVANLKLGKYVAAEKACSTAIIHIEANGDNYNHTRYLKSIAYSNRGIVHHYLGSKANAFEDFNTALSFDANDVVMDNLKALNIALLKQELKVSTTAMNY
ncbi:hypothetical protein [Thalassomonas sp. M1454]|uniref:hypothetical protein n=1 Tax=Thalassomonas sp. M1454 TaxID=2594477 RepID=UPI001180F596|nr:hypothetical protein [Thalassomonas sp. M1454]TRX52705.1 hypothetical protein FNN08_15190 [Thalassomonas sp. M1454]